MSFFSVNGKFYNGISMLWDAVKINFLWIIFSLPIITIGASTVALFTVSLKMVENNEGHVVKQFIQAFKDNWKQGIILGLISLLLAYFVYLNFEFFRKLEAASVWFLIFTVFIAFISLFHLLYAFAIVARYETTVWGAMVNSKNITTRYFLKSLLLWLILAMVTILFIWNYTLMFIGVLFGPVTFALLISSFVMPMFKKIDVENN